MIAIVSAMSTEVEPIVSQMNVLKTFSEESAKFYQAEFSGFPITIAQSGVGRDRARAATECLLQLFKIHLIISTGFAGSLQEEVNTGDLIIAKSVLNSERVAPMAGHGAHKPGMDASREWKAVSRLPCETSYVRLAKDICNDEGLNIHVGDTVTVDELIAQSKGKMYLGKNFSALAVDMETAVVGQVAFNAGIPFVSVRSISDDVTDDIVVDYKRFVDEGGNVRLRSALTQILHVVPHLLYLRRMHKQANVAADTLALFLPQFITGLYNQILL